MASGPADFDRAVERRPERDVGERLDDLIRHDRLHERRRQTIDVAVERRFRDPFDELEELRRLQDRVGDGRRLDEVLLRSLGPHVPAFDETLRADDRQRDVMLHARRLLGREQIAAGGDEEVHRGLVVERRGVRDVDHDLGARERLRQALAGERVDARLRRGGDNLVSAPAQQIDKLRSDEAGASDHDDLHSRIFLEFEIGFDEPSPLHKLGGESANSYDSANTGGVGRGIDRAIVQTHAVVWFGSSPTSGQYSQVAGTQRKASPATATWQTDGNDR